MANIPTSDGRVGEHPIEGLMRTAMDSIKGMVDVNTVVGQPVETREGGTIIPISRVTFGFAAGGGEYWNQRAPADGHPFGGGSGAGVTVHPVGFLVVQGETVRLLSVDRGDTVDNLIASVPQFMDQVQGFLNQRKHERESSSTTARSTATTADRGLH